MNQLRENWLLDPTIHFVNHGSFGACPQRVLDHQRLLRDQLEREPVAFMQRELPVLLEESLGVLGAFVGARPEDLAFVTNASTGVNAVLRSLPLEDGDELLVTDQAYPACRQAIEFVAARSGAQIRLVEIPLEATTGELVDRIVAAATNSTKLALIDHVASATAVIFPVAEIVAELAELGVDTLVDGAHAPGMMPIDLDEIGAAYYTGNCHKWMCAPKGAAFLHVRSDRHSTVVPTVISHGYDVEQESRAFRAMFDWVGTADPTAALSVGSAIDAVGGLVPGGWPDVMKANQELATAGAEIVGAALGQPPRTPMAVSGSMVAFALPDGYPAGARWDPLQDRLLYEHNVEVPISPWPAAPKRLLRISAHLYNDLDDYRALAAGLRATIGA